MGAMDGIFLLIRQEKLTEEGYAMAIVLEQNLPAVHVVLIWE
jgi:hypothetical protein